MFAISIFNYLVDEGTHTINSAVVDFLFSVLSPIDISYYTPIFSWRTNTESPNGSLVERMRTPIRGNTHKLIEG